MDGVLADNNIYHKIAWKKFLKKQNIDINEDIFEQKISGKTNHDILRSFLGSKKTDLEINDLALEKEKMYRKEIKNKLKPVLGLKKFLDEAIKNKIKIAIATSAPPKNVSLVLKTLGVSKYFKIIIDDTDVTAGKPDPQIYLLTAKKLKNPKSLYVVFEDSLAGIESAKKAKMKVIALATTQTKKELVAADLAINDFSEINLDKINSLFYGRKK